ncbi:PH domain-containing protein [Chloroflexota bacterium]
MLLLESTTFTGYRIKNTKFEMGDRHLQIKGDVYSRSTPRGWLVKEGVRIINLNIEPEYQLRLRTNGINLPGYQEGWFKLKNNEKALLCITNYTKVVYIPTTKDYSVLLNVNRPDELHQTIPQWK